MNKVLDKIQYQSCSSREVIDKIIRVIDFKRSRRRKNLSRNFQHNDIYLNSIYSNDGVIFSNAEELNLQDLVSKVLNETEQVLSSNQKLTSTSGKKSYLRSIMQTTDFNLQSSVFELAFSSKIVGRVAAMLNDFPVLNGIHLYYSPPSNGENSNNFVGSQLFHMDEEDTKLCKLWVILKDVKVSDGPTVVIKKKTSKRIASNIKYKKGMKISNDNDLLQYCDKTDIITILGNKGDLVFIDTAGSFHYGSRVSSKSSGRYLLMISYGTSYNLDHGLFGRNSKFKNLNYSNIKSDLSPRFIRMLLDSGAY